MARARRDMTKRAEHHRGHAHGATTPNAREQFQIARVIPHMTPTGYTSEERGVSKTDRNTRRNTCTIDTWVFTAPHAGTSMGAATTAREEETCIMEARVCRCSSVGVRGRSMQNVPLTFETYGCVMKRQTERGDAPIRTRYRKLTPKRGPLSNHKRSRT